jgi:plastocyanin
MRGPRTAAVALFILASTWATVGAAAATGALRGRVTSRAPAAPPALRPSVTELGSPRPADLPDRRRSVVYLETAPQGAFEEAEAAHLVLDQKNQTFRPYVLAVTLGTTVDFVNSDSTYHNVFSLSKTKRFDLGRYPRGESRSVRFDRPGVVRVFCEIHSHMSAFILVFAHRYFATTDAEGRYRIEGIPSGTYTAVVWNDGAERDRRTIVVPESGGAVDLDVELE